MIFMPKGRPLNHAKDYRHVFFFRMGGIGVKRKSDVSQDKQDNPGSGRDEVFVPLRNYAFRPGLSNDRAEYEGREREEVDEGPGLYDGAGAYRDINAVPDFRINRVKGLYHHVGFAYPLADGFGGALVAGGSSLRLDDCRAVF